MHKYKVEIVTLADAQKFVSVATEIQGSVKLVDDSGFCINGKSLLGAIAALEWNSLYCISDTDIYNKIKDFVKS